MMSKINEHQKWPTNKKQYDKNYLRLWGKICPECNGYGIYPTTKNTIDSDVCRACNGIGYIEK